MRASSPDREIELKLLVDPACLDQLAELLCANVKAFAAPKPRQLESHYFDTGDRRLRARGASLRVRRTGGSFVQTVKTRSEDSGAHSVRGEWECPVAGPVPELDAVADPAALERLGMVLPEELEHVFVTNVERRLVLVEQAVPGAGSSIIEVAFDRGAVVANGMGTARPDGKAPRARAAKARSEPIAEVELELKAGSARGLYLLLAEMRPWAPLQIAVADKAERGYRLADGGSPPAARATRPVLEPTMTVSDALGAILRNCLGQWLRNVAAARDGRDIEGVHQLRIAARRCRSALSLFTDAIGRDARVAWNERLKAVIAATGRARELDVFLAETLPEVAHDQASEDMTALAALARRAEIERRDAYGEVRAFLGERVHADLVLDLASWVALDRWQEEASPDRGQILESPIVDLARRLLEKRHKQVRKLGRHFGRLSDAERHEVRLALKKLRYGVEFLGGLFPAKAAKRYGKAAAGLQDVLGQLNDQVETHVLLAGLGRGVPARPIGERLDVQRGIGFMLGWQARSMTAQRAAAERAWETFMAQPLFWHPSGDDA